MHVLLSFIEQLPLSVISIEHDSETNWQKMVAVPIHSETKMYVVYMADYICLENINKDFRTNVLLRQIYWWPNWVSFIE